MVQIAVAPISSAAPTAKFPVNKLAEYMTAGPSRRATLIRQIADGKPYRNAWYTPARAAIVRFVLEGTGDTERLVRTAEKLRSRPRADDFERRQGNLSARAIEAFLRMAAEFEYGSHRQLVRPSSKRGSMVISEVLVSVRPDVLVLDRSTGEVVGGLKLHFSTSHRLPPEGLKSVSAVVREFLGRESSRAMDPAVCEAVDVFGGLIEPAPRAVARRWADIEAACVEIARAWPGLSDH